MEGELFFEVIQGKEGMGGIEPFLILPVTALDLAIVSRGVGANQFMPDAQVLSSLFKKGRKVPLAVGKAIGKLKTIVRLNAFHLNPLAAIPPCQPS